MTVDIDPATFTLLDETGTPATSVPAKDPSGNVIGTYTLKTVGEQALQSLPQLIRLIVVKFNLCVYRLKIKMVFRLKQHTHH